MSSGSPSPENRFSTESGVSPWRSSSSVVGVRAGRRHPPGARGRGGDGGDRRPARPRAAPGLRAARTGAGVLGVRRRRRERSPRDARAAPPVASASPAGGAAPRPAGPRNRPGGVRTARRRRGRRRPSPRWPAGRRARSARAASSVQVTRSRRASAAASAASGRMSACLIFQRPDICSMTSLESIRTSTGRAVAAERRAARASPAIRPAVLGDVVGRGADRLGDLGEHLAVGGVLDHRAVAGRARVAAGRRRRPR